MKLCVAFCLAAFVACASLASSIYQLEDFVPARAMPLAEGALPADTIAFACDADDWRRVMGNVAPPDWMNGTAGMVLFVGPLSHEFSCGNIEWRTKDDFNVITLRRPTDSAPPASSGCAISAQRTVRAEPLVITANWSWEYRLATIRNCGERVTVAHSDTADFVRVRVRARDAATSRPFDLTDANVLLSGQPGSRSALVGRDGDAILAEVPAWIRYDVVVQPKGCGEFRFFNQSITPGQVSTLELDLGLMSSLSVRVSRDDGKRKVPLTGASVAAYYAGQNSLIVGGVTDETGRAVLACIPSGTLVDVRATSRGFFEQDACGIAVGPSGSSVDLLSKPNPDPRRRPIPPVCSPSSARSWR